MLRSARACASASPRLPQLCNVPADVVRGGKKKKALRSYEQAVVPWTDEAMVPVCPECGRRFKRFTRRPHHCRLTGFVMCDECSVFLPLREARALSARGLRSAEPPRKHSQDFAADGTERTIRVRRDCLALLMWRKSRATLRDTAAVPAVVLYARIVAVRKEMEQSMPRLTDLAAMLSKMEVCS